MVASTFEEAADLFSSAFLGSTTDGGGIGVEVFVNFPVLAHPAPPPSSQVEIFLTMTHWLTVATTSSSARGFALLCRPPEGVAILLSSVCKSPPRSGHGLFRNLSNSDDALATVFGGGFGADFGCLGLGGAPGTTSRYRVTSSFSGRDRSVASVTAGPSSEFLRDATADDAASGSTSAAAVAVAADGDAFPLRGAFSARSETWSRVMVIARARMLGLIGSRLLYHE